ncbi:ATPase, histidine kinase-, DNA gyrase B-, and HSP90-like domain protein [Verrucomicrobiia bacterium DG1235]|nr:ATPase, histidine kinase-, DNA gyrase B-, and HSP90-like domain protein [Verrucomicrobiae bacterium DG1235]
MRPRNLYSTFNYIQFLVAILLACHAIPTPTEAKNSLRGIPYYRVFTSQDFDSGASSEFVTTAADGTVFYGDRNWIFLYDGAVWHKIYQNSGTTEKITALLWDEDGRIYAGGFNAFGELIVDSENKASFRHLVPRDQINNGEHFQKIFNSSDSIYLTGRRSFACYNKADGTIDTHVFSTWLTASFLLDGKFHLLTDENEIYHYENGELIRPEEIVAGNNSNEVTIADIVIGDQGEVIMASERRGLFRFDGRSFQKAYPKYEHDSKNLVRDIELTKDNRLLVASLGGGITVLDPEGNALEQLGSDIDHRFKSARSVTVDKSGTVWAMFNSTLAKILLDSPLTAIDEHIRPSFFYASQHLHGDELYIRSFYILYRAVFDESGRIKSFENALPDADLEVWSVAESNEGLYINTANQGIFRLANNKLEYLVGSKAYDCLVQSKSNPAYIIGANSDTIALYKKNGQGLELVDAINNNGGVIYRAEEDGQGDFWLEYGLGAAGRISIQNDKITHDYYSSSHGLSKNEWMSIWIHEGKALFTGISQILTLDEGSQKFVAHEILKSDGIEESLRIERAFTDPSGNLWISANDKNIIYWKTSEGVYQRDETSLSEMGEPYFEFIKFLENGEALIMTAFEFFHFQQTDNPLAQHASIPPTRIISIADSNENTLHYTYLANSSQPEEIRFDYSDNSLAFTVSNAFTYSTLLPQFQHFLEGFSNDEPEAGNAPWTSSSSTTFTNLHPGFYTYKARARLGNGYLTPWTEYSFSIAPPIYQTSYAYLGYAVVSAFLILVTIKVNSSRLRKQNLKLESMVAARTKEIESKNDTLETQANELESKNRELATQSHEIKRNALELSAALVQLQETQDQLLTTARIAGRAEVATNVLHNVGNVLNSVNVGISSLDKQVGRSRVANLKKISNLIYQNRQSLGHYFSEDERGKRIPEYLEQLSDALVEELDTYKTEITQIEGNVDHIKRIISTQQTHAKKIGIIQNIKIADLLDSALALTLGESYEAEYKTDRRYATDLQIRSDKHMLLDVLINLIKNAKESITERQSPDKKLTIACKRVDPDSIEISIADNGIGIEAQHQDILFTHGYTTKKDGHGFGLHSCANAIKTLGGSLSLTSPGPRKGATATITLPRQFPNTSQ